MSAVNDIAISARNVSKCYRVYDNQRSRLLNAVWPRYDGGAQEVWALKDVSFELKRGESLGIIGRNGGGKSTLLEILSGTLTPTSGDVKISGRVSALLELGSGFNPEYSGRDNVILNGLLLGLSRDDILDRFGEIEAFAEIGAAIDRPVKTYSSGMVVRLAFAVQVLCDPDILIVDEALSVGDFFFQQKCFARLRRMRHEGLTLLFVSHDMGTVRDLCSTALYLMKGRAVFRGDSNLAIKQYLAEEHVEPAAIDRAAAADDVAAVTAEIDSQADGQPGARPDDQRAAQSGQQRAPQADTLIEHALWRRDPSKAATESGDALLAIIVTDSTGRPATTVRMGERLTVEVRCRVASGMTRHASLLLKNRYDQIVTCRGTYAVGMPLSANGRDEYRTVRFDVECAIEAGLYSLMVALGEVTTPNRGQISEESGWLGPITVQWDYETQPAPFLGMFGVPITVSLENRDVAR